jgi:alkylation response protein AidB-like acyl-CoA dehydrogenase
MVLRSSLLFAQLLQAHVATRAALDHLGAWILRQPAPDQRAVLALVGLECDWQAADALMAVAEDGDVQDGLLAAAAVSHAAGRIRRSEWTALAGGVVPWLPALAPASDLLAAHLAGMATAIGVGLTPIQRQRQEQLGAFAANVLQPQLPESDDPVLPTGALVLEMAGQQAWQRSVPAAYGGQPVPLLDQILDAQGFAEAGPVIGALAGHPVMAIQALLQAGTESQRQAWLPGLVTGEALATVAAREAQSGDDPAGWTTTARQHDDGWILDGSKPAVWFAGPAHWLAIAARLGQGQGQGEVAWFIVPKPQLAGPVWQWEAPEGGRIDARLSAGPAPGGMVRHDLHVRGLRLPAGARLGDGTSPDQGTIAYLVGWAHARLQMAGIALGLLQTAYEAVWRGTVSRCVAGRQGLDSALIRQYLAGLAWRIQAARQLTYRTARLAAPTAGAAALAQFAAARTCEHAVRLISQLLAEPGPADAGLWRSWRHLTALPVLAGSEDVLALGVIGPHLLRLPQAAT